MTTVPKLDPSIAQLMLLSFSAEDLRHLAAIADARCRVPTPLAKELAAELAEIVSAPPLEREAGLIFNRPTIGWWQRARERLAEDPGIDIHDESPEPEWPEGEW